MIKKKWVSDNSKIDLINFLKKETGLDESVIRILVNRNIDTKEEVYNFLNPSLSNLFDPFLLNDMDKAVERIKDAIKNKEKIFIYGDYDADGVTASSLLYLSVKKVYGDVSIYIPEREKEGYGLNSYAIDKIKAMGGSLIITVDCGITSVDEAEYAKNIGIDMIITDHHTCPDSLPSCVAVINPKRKDSTYPFKELCGAGVSLKLSTALGLFDERLLAICAIGTIADIVPLVSENRIIAYYGIESLKKGILPNINVLMEVSELSYKDINARTIGFLIAPKINAAGRMENAGYAVEFFTTSDNLRMKELALYLDNLNKTRQECEKEILISAKEKIEKDDELKEDILILSGEGWHEGVIGIVASRITEEYHKPCILLSVNDGIAKGSSRSIKGFNIYEALKAVSENLEKFGGHELAAGLTVKEEKLSVFKEEIQKYAKEIFKNGRIYPEIMIDCELKESNINIDFAEFLLKLEPYGMGNSEPVFLIKGSKVINSYPFSNDKHMRLIVKKGDKELETVGFGLGLRANSLKRGDNIYIALTFGINEFRGNKKVQGIVKDIKLEK